MFGNFVAWTMFMSYLPMFRYNLWHELVFFLIHHHHHRITLPKVDVLEIAYVQQVSTMI